MNMYSHQLRLIQQRQIAYCGILLAFYLYVAESEDGARVSAGCSPKGIDQEAITQHTPHLSDHQRLAISVRRRPLSVDGVS
ncbi:MAG: hypothetical protein MST03_08110 [Bacteroidales bacterium]|nr:hypothetical protein [Bacteroidales bacterium]